MSSSTTTLPRPQPAPWRDEFLAHLKKTPEFAFATIASAPSSEREQGEHGTRRQHGAPSPRVRFCVCRGMFGAPPPPFPRSSGAEHSTPESPPAGEEAARSVPAAAAAAADGGGAAGSGPEVATAGRQRPLFKTDCPVFTTDARMRKNSEIAANAGVEGAWWIASAGVQWRIRGVAHVVSPQCHEGEGGENGDDGDAAEGEGEATPAERLLDGDARGCVMARMYDAAEDLARGQGWSWEGEVAAWFAAQSPRIRGSSLAPFILTP
jgi:pyridoxamine 5'-phosphate oxidase